ncbi:hypothetical protein I5G62_gp68 [Mycobacterium phage CRB2]|uniref:Uncharacterized protein n=1 Tax=Mycobacterium phage CRB2 TaxID=2483623 RepID=A0A455LM31_9CAUD|nr:hypothetical protein I5G62_gp68 [Mycobacterium phage CRB2]AYP70054.1 hypothetical protein CRB2_68 [Mycobacterium phage CRB2]
MGIQEMHDDEVRARLGLAPVDRPATIEERIEANMVRAMPEPYDVEDHPRCTCRDSDVGWMDCPVHPEPCR